MNNKRNEELADKVKNILSNDLVNGYCKDAISELLDAYSNATYEGYDGRHKWYREVVDDMVNDFGFQDEKLAEKMANNHCTLQQSFFRFVMKFIKKMAEKEYYDGRNEASVKTAKKIMEALDSDNIYFPMI